MRLQTPFRCVLLGSESLLLSCAEVLLERGHAIAAVIGSAPAIASWCSEQGVARLDPADRLAERLRDDACDLLFAVSHTEPLPASLCALPQRGAIRFLEAPVHTFAGSNLPSWGLLDGESRWGVSWYLEPASPDSAPEVLLVREFEVADNETALTLNARCYEQAIESFSELLGSLESGALEPNAGRSEQVRRHPASARPSALALLDWARPARELERLARALDHGRYANPLAVPKLLTSDGILLVEAVTAAEATPSRPAGSVVEATDGTLRVAVSDGEVALTGLHSAEGRALSAAEVASIGGLLPTAAESLRRQIDNCAEAFARHEPFWRRRLSRLVPLEWPLAAGAIGREPEHNAATTLRRTIDLPENVSSAAEVAAAFFSYLFRLSGTCSYHLDYRGAALAPCTGSVAGVYAEHVPLEVGVSGRDSFGLLAARADAELRRVERRGSFALDLIARAPELRDAGDRSTPRLPIAIEISEDLAAESRHPLCLRISPDGRRAEAVADAKRVDAQALDRFGEHLATLLAAALRDREQTVEELPLLGPAERTRLVDEWNHTDVDYDRSACVHELISRQAERTPEAAALVCGERSVSFAELDGSAELLAQHLRALGVGPDVLVGLCLERSVEMVIGALAIWKAGGAYVPMDPGFPADRIALMIEDSKAPVILTDSGLLPRLPPHSARIVCVDREFARQGEKDEQPLDSPAAAPENLAYAIYTSGSTGRPKGVLVEHRNVVNFFQGMDERIPHDPAGVWLALTSLSFDISVLELFWALARGFRVVIQPERELPATGQRLEHAERPIDFSLFFFASDESAGSREKYRLLLDSARFADESGFSAVWTPERHFHAFGGLYPNPAVIGAALATITERVRIRAGSCVLPLHSPIRVAEEWAVVDNLSGGRVDIAFAAGWQQNDFALRPESFAESKKVMLEGIDCVRKLWRGESVEFPGPKGPVDVRTLPRPVQPELPVWITTAGNPDTWRGAAEKGCSVLTHLLGQTLEEVSEKIELYRTTWEQAGHAGRGHVTLMLHTFVWDDPEVVLEHAREPMKDYLRSSVGLIKDAAWSFPAFKVRLDRDGASPNEIFEGGLSDEEMDALLEHSFERYHRTGSLIGTPDQCVELIDRLKGIGVDEVACQIDFGVAEDAVRDSLQHLKRVVADSQPSAVVSADSVSELCRRHRVTHLQCTPSMAQMLLASDEERLGFESLDVVMIGGEAFPSTLAAELDGLGDARVLNMYGPTETTVWSATHELGSVRSGASVPLGRPLANTQLYVVDDRLELVPQGARGELLIGGEGVVRGYHARPELTEERFVPDPFRPGSGSRVYRTGDLVRWREDGVLEFLGRSDHQVKIRGYRIELGEIEALLLEQPDVREAAAVVREDVPGDKRLVAYVIPRSGESPDPGSLRRGLRARLPDYMVPSAVVTLDHFPLTPNAKIDRNALPAPEEVRRQSAPTRSAAPPENALQRTLAGIWSDALQLNHVGLDDNFFDLGGHSLLAIRVHRRIRTEIDRPLSITDLFRLPTLRALAEFLSGGDGAAKRITSTAKQRAEARLAARGQRRRRDSR